MPNDWGDEAATDWGDAPATPATPAKTPPPKDFSVLERVGQMIMGQPTTPYGEAMRWIGGHAMSGLPGRGTYEEERRRIAQEEGMPDLTTDKRAYLKEGDKRWREEAPYLGLGVHTPMRVGVPGLTSPTNLAGKPIFTKAADAAERSGARYMTRSLHTNDPTIQTLREHLSTPKGDVGLDVGRVIQDLQVPSTGQQVVPAVSRARTQNTRAQQALEDLGPAIGDTIADATTRNPRSVRVKELLDEASAAAESMDTRATRAVAPKSVGRFRTIAQQIIDEYMEARETAAHVKYDEPGQVEMGATSTTTTHPGRPHLRPGVPTEVVGYSRELPGAEVVERPGYTSSLPRTLELEAPVRDPKTGRIVRQGRYAQNRQTSSQPPGYEQPMMSDEQLNLPGVLPQPRATGERAAGYPPNAAGEARAPLETARLVGGVDDIGPTGDPRITMQQQLDPAFYGETPPAYVNEATGAPLTAEKGGTRYQGTNRPNPDAPVHVNLKHAPAVPHPGTPEVATQGHLFPAALDAAGEWAPAKVPPPPGPPKHVGSDVELGPSMNPEELHALIQKLDEEVWKTGMEGNSTNPQAYIDANPELKLKQRIAGVAAEKLREAVTASLGETRGEWFAKDMRDFHAAKAISEPLKTSANKEASGSVAGEGGGVSPSTLRRVILATTGTVGLATGNPGIAAAAAAGDVGMTLAHKYGASLAGRGLQKASKALRVPKQATYNVLPPAAMQRLVQEMAAQKIRDDKEKKNAP